MPSRDVENDDTETGKMVSELEQKLIPISLKVDAYTLGVLAPSNGQQGRIMKKVMQASNDGGLPPISSTESLARFMAIQCQITQAKHALELGTLGGFGCIYIALLNPQISFTSIEYSPKHAEVARANIEMAGLSSRIEVLEGKGMDVLPKVCQEIKDGKRPEFDFGYFDADKGNNWNYMSMAAGVANPGAVLMCDNVVFSGDIVDEEKQDKDWVAGARTMIEGVGSDDRFGAAVVLQILSEGYWDGILVTTVKK